jgi:hypothetical protein
LRDEGEQLVRQTRKTKERRTSFLRNTIEGKRTPARKGGKRGRRTRSPGNTKLYRECREIEGRSRLCSLSNDKNCLLSLTTSEIYK